MIKDPCKICQKAVHKNHKAIRCDQCKYWVHIKCNQLNNATYTKLQQDETAWFCLHCSQGHIPFSNLTDTQFNSLHNKGTTSFDINMEDDIVNYINQINDPINEISCKYYTVEEIKSIKPKHSNNYLHLNISSLQYHFESLESMLSSIDIDFNVIAITESRLIKDKNLSRPIDLPSFSFEHTPTESKKGGALLYISNSTKYKCRADLKIYKAKELESVFIETLSPDNTIIGCIYRHPCMDANEFNQDFLTPLLEKLSFEKKPIILLGDFNIDLLQYESNCYTTEFFNILSSNMFKPCIDKPTRLTSRSRTLIDNTYTNDVTKNNISGNIAHSISDHLPQFLLSESHSYTNKNKTSKTFRDFTNFDQENFLSDLQNIDWDMHLRIAENDANFSMNKFLHIINSILDRYAPLKTQSNSKRKKLFHRKPWITNGIIKSITIRDKYHKKYINSKNVGQKEILGNHFRRYRNKIVQLTKISKTNYYKNYFLENKHNLRKTWQGIKSIILTKNKNHNAPDCLNIDNKASFNLQDITESFNSYFSSIAQSIEAKIIPTNVHYQQYLTTPNPNSIFLTPVSGTEVSDVINSFSVYRSTGPSSIDTKILKTINNIVSDHFAKIINISFSTGVFPDLLKEALISPIHKSGSKLDPKNYRPISLLSNLSKIFEKVIYKRLISFFDNHNSLYESQYGFRSKHSLNHALIQITEKIRKCIDDKQFACGVFIDLQKAFDTVNHNILLYKLSYYGIRGLPLSLLQSYLQDRSQKTNINGISSSSRIITHGVPQGSILGPLLFLIYINDLHKSIIHSETHLFADDTNLLYTNKSVKKLNQHMNHDLKSLQIWLRANKISLNAKKTQLIIFRSPKIHIKKHLNFRICGQKLQPTTHLKYLGIILDEHLNWKAHINTLSSKLSRSIGLLSKIRHFVSYVSLHSLYYSLFHSHLTFGCQLWAQSLNNQNIKIQNLQNKAMRIINFKGYRESVHQLYSKSKVLKLHDFVFQQNCVLAKQFLNRSLPNSFNDFLTKITDNHTHFTRGAAKSHFHASLYSTNFGIFSVSNQTILAWNSLSKILPEYNATESSIASLTSEIKKYFFFKYCDQQ